MAYEFKNLNEVPAQDKPTENTTIMAFENGVPKQIPSGEFGGKCLIIDLSGYGLDINGMNTISDISYDPIYDSIRNGKPVMFIMPSGAYTLFNSVCVIPDLGLVSLIFDVCNESEYAVRFTNGSYHGTPEVSSE